MRAKRGDETGEEMRGGEKRRRKDKMGQDKVR